MLHYDRSSLAERDTKAHHPRTCGALEALGFEVILIEITLRAGDKDTRRTQDTSLEEDLSSFIKEVLVYFNHFKAVSEDVLAATWESQRSRLLRLRKDR